MSHCGLKSPHLGLLPDEENRKCGIVKYCAEFLSIGNHSPKRKRTQGGLSNWRHSRRKWKLEQNIIVGMVVNALLCGRGRSCCPARNWVYILHDSGSMNSMEGEQVGEV